MIGQNILPLSALVGLDIAKQALLLLAVEPKLRGIMLAASAGTGKSSLARGIQELIANPAVLGDAAPFVEAPTSADVENLLGGLDLESTLRSGQTIVRHGLLAQADGGIVYVDGINLLLDASANLLLSVLDEGEVRVEREGLSMITPARFSLIGSYDPSEGLPRNHLLDRVGLLVNLNQMPDASDRAMVIRHNLLSTDAEWDEETVILSGLVQAAREILPDVTISSDQMAQLSQSALAYGVAGHRVDLFAIHAACASAALNLREEVEDEDMELAARLVILPRATQVPTPPPEDPPEESPERGQEMQPPEQNQSPDPKQAPQPPDDERTESPDQGKPDESDLPPPDDDLTDRPPDAEMAVPDDQVLTALASELPDELDELPFRTIRRGRAGSRGAMEGTRGRHVRSLPGDPKRWRLDALATLRVSAPWQSYRREAKRKMLAARARGWQRLPLPSWFAALWPNYNQVEKKLYFEPSDIRVKHYRSKAGALFCFAVDASGSMALHRMRQAKGAVHSLLEKAYVKRDRVALISFRGQEAEVLMPPTQSVELARRALDLLPTGGGTPLASALLLGHEMAQQAQSRGIHQTVLVLLTDGRGNVPLRADSGADKKAASKIAEAELEKIGAIIAHSNLHVVVVDTQRSFLSKGEAKQLAKWVGGEYAYLPNGSGEEIAQIASSIVGE